jgi:hypothetical protein
MCTVCLEEFAYVSCKSCTHEEGVDLTRNYTEDFVRPDCDLPELQPCGSCYMPL